MSKSILPHRYKYLIIGSGGAGLKVALELAKAGYEEETLIIGARNLADPHTVLAAGGINAALGTMDPQDSWQYHCADTFYEGGMISNPDAIEYLTKRAPEAIEELRELGAEFETDDDGRLIQRFFGAHTFRRTVFHGDQTGLEIIRVLSRAVKATNIRYLEQTYVFDFIQGDDGRINGVLAVDIEDQIHRIEADYTVIATGGFSNIYTRSSSRLREGFGSIIATAARYGAELGDMEMVQFHPTGLVYPSDVAGKLVTEAVRAEGGILRNSKGERFMKRYAPELLELATRDVVARAIYQEISSGHGTTNGGVYLDITTRTRSYLKRRLPKILDTLQKYNGIDISRHPMEVAPTAHYTMGGIRVEFDSLQTSLEGLYAVGECTMGVHGANRLGGNSLAEILVFGTKLGRHLCEQPKAETHSSKEDRIPEIISQYTQSGAKHPLPILRKLYTDIWDKAGIVRNGKDLKTLLNSSSELMGDVHPTDLHNDGRSLRHTIALKSRLSGVALLAYAVSLSASLRTESRGAHYRSDYIETSADMRHNIIMTYDQMELKARNIQVPEGSEAFKYATKRIERTENYGHLE